MAAAHHRDAVRHRHRLALVVGDEDEGRAGRAVQRATIQSDLLAQLEVERAERLVEQQHLRIVDSARAMAMRLPLPARQRVDAPVAVAGQAHQLQRLGHLRADGGALPLLISSPKAMFCATVRCGNSAMCWKIMLVRRRYGGSATALRPPISRSPALGVSKPPDDAQKGRLAAARRAQQEKNSPCRMSRVVGANAATVP